MTEHYYEVVIEGNLDLLKGFVIGFLAGRGVEGGIFFDAACRIDPEECETGPLLRLVHAHSNTHIVIIRSDLHDLVVAALTKQERVIQLHIKKVRRVLSAAFTCTFRTYSREVGAELKAIVSGIPEGVDNSGFVMHETLDPEGKGVELYTPLHDYELTGEGWISGSVKGVLDLYQKLERFEVVELGKLEPTFEKSPEG